MPVVLPKLLSASLVLAGLLFCAESAAALPQLLERIERLDQDYQQLMTEIPYAKNGDLADIDDIEELAAGIESIGRLEHPVAALPLLAANLDTLLAFADEPAAANITDFLLEHNQRLLVQQIYRQLQAEANDGGLAYLRYNLAKYHARLNHWPRVIELIGEGFSDLSSDDSDFANLLQGSALQHLKQHRSAIESYANIPESSKYYLHARINTAIALLRQDWVTDARLNLEAILPTANNRTESKLSNRIYLLLGYALLNREYYRDARAALRKVAIDSQYANKALLGIALTAINQGDYIGGLNALLALKQNPRPDLAADEAYVILPYVYQRLQQSNRIADSFLESIDHFQQRILELNQIRDSQQLLQNMRLDKATGAVFLGDRRFEFSQAYPVYLIQNRDSLHYLSKVKTNPKIDRLLTEHDRVLGAVLSDLIEAQKNIYLSYLNQSRFGLAQHYDSNQQGDP